MAAGAAAGLRFASIVKKTTGLVGLDVVPNAREVLIKLYEKTLNDVKIIPEGVAYRREVEKLASHRLGVVKKHEDVLAIEREIGMGQAEELIEEAKSELVLIPEYASWRMWEKKRPSPEDDEMASFYDDLEAVDPESVAYLGLRDLAESKRATAADSRRKAAAASAAAAAAAAGGGAKPAAAGKPA